MFIISYFSKILCFSAMVIVLGFDVSASPRDFGNFSRSSLGFCLWYHVYLIFCQVSEGTEILIIYELHEKKHSVIKNTILPLSIQKSLSVFMSCFS